MLPTFVDYNELASESNGGKILFATDDFFAVAENLLKDDEPVWKEDAYTEYGKWMDGWETRRKRIAGHDWTIIALKVAMVMKGICVDTSYFIGNYAPKFSIQAANLQDEDLIRYQKREDKMGTGATEKDYKRVATLKSHHWETIVPVTELNPGHPNASKHYFPISSKESWTHLRLNIFPDGGIARLRVYGIAKPNWSSIPKHTLIDLVAKENGGFCVSYSDAHFGHPSNLIKPEKGASMSDGWETARRLDRPANIHVDDRGFLAIPGEEWAIFKLGAVGNIVRVEVDTSYFKGNYPDNIRLEGALVKSGIDSINWHTILPVQKLSPDKIHTYSVNASETPINHIRVVIAPDGGFSRLRIWGYRA